MKAKKFLVTLLSLALVITALCGCGGADTETDPFAKLTFYESPTGISLYMDKGFTEKTMETATCYFEKSDIVTNCLEETFETLETIGYGSETTIEEYAQLLIDVYGLEGEVTTDEYGNTYTVYIQDFDGVSYSYYAFFDKGTTSFWTTTFLCATDEADSHEEDFKLWASSIKVP